MTDGNTANDTHASKPDPVTPGERAAFERDGYHLLRPLFTAAEAAEWRNRINHVFGFPVEPDATPQIAGATHTLADGVTTNDDFWPVIFNERLLATVRALIGDDIRYTQHSDLHINLPGGRWHRDSACRDFGVGADWDESEVPYRVVRVAIYLSDHTQSNSSLVVLPGSHRHESRLRRAEYVFWNNSQLPAPAREKRLAAPLVPERPPACGAHPTRRLRYFRSAPAARRRRHRRGRTEICDLSFLRDRQPTFPQPSGIFPQSADLQPTLARRTSGAPEGPRVVARGIQPLPPIPSFL